MNTWDITKTRKRRRGIVEQAQIQYILTESNRSEQGADADKNGQGSTCKEKPEVPKSEQLEQANDKEEVEKEEENDEMRQKWQEGIITRNTKKWSPMAPKEKKWEWADNKNPEKPKPRREEEEEEEEQQQQLTTTHSDGASLTSVLSPLSSTTQKYPPLPTHTYTTKPSKPATTILPTIVRKRRHPSVLKKKLEGVKKVRFGNETNVENVRA
ncbi:hypothetical protein RFI_21306, partial [Reticulomyxa filosa]